jgi:branched-chain amino acid transport system permease protein
VAFFGIAAMIEMVYHLQLNEALGPVLKFLGLQLDAKALSSWLGALVVAAVGVLLFVQAGKRFARRWSEVQGEIETMLHAQEAA